MNILYKDKHGCEIESSTGKYIYSKNHTEYKIILSTSTEIDDINDKYKNILLICESPSIENNNYIYDNLNKFDLVLTCHKIFLDLNLNKIKFISLANTWINTQDHFIYTKTKNCSMILSDKKYTEGHLFRHAIASVIQSLNLNINLFGNSYCKFNNKIETLKEFRFSIVIENCKEDYYFSEKLIDCFLTGNVPIYWGCPSINKFFNTKGMIIIDETNYIKKLKLVNENIYNHMLPHIKDNFEKALKYSTFNLKINDNYIDNILGFK